MRGIAEKGRWDHVNTKSFGLSQDNAQFSNRNKWIGKIYEPTANPGSPGKK